MYSDLTDTEQTSTSRSPNHHLHRDWDRDCLEAAGSLMDTILQDMEPALELTSLVEWADSNLVVEYPRKCWVWEWEQGS